MRYFDFNDKEITETEYKSRIAEGKRFTQRGMVENGNRIGRMRQMSPEMEVQRDKEEAVYRENNPATLDAFKTKKLDKIRLKVSMKYSKFVDKHHQKKIRKASTDQNYTIPDAVVGYADALELFFDNFKNAVNACTTQAQCELVRPSNNGNPDFPDDSAVKNL